MFPINFIQIEASQFYEVLTRSNSTNGNIHPESSYMSLLIYCLFCGTRAAATEPARTNIVGQCGMHSSYALVKICVLPLPSMEFLCERTTQSSLFVNVCLVWFLHSTYLPLIRPDPSWLIPGIVGRSIHWTMRVGSLSAVLLVELDGVCFFFFVFFLFFFVFLHTTASNSLNYFICWLLSEYGIIGDQKKQGVEHYPHKPTNIGTLSYENDMSKFQLNHHISFASYFALLEILLFYLLLQCTYFARIANFLSHWFCFLLRSLVTS